MISPQAKRNILRIVPFGIAWFIFSLVYSLLERGLLGNLATYPATGNPYNFKKTFFVTLLSSSIVGLIIGSIEVLYFNQLFIRKTFTQKIFYKTIAYLSMIILFLLIVTAVYNAVLLNTTIFNKVAWSHAWDFFVSFAFWSVAIYVATMIGVTLFYNEVSENLGLEVLNNFFTGKYHTPTEEERIFMFVDMKSSTTIAENIGHVRYFQMLKAYFTDLTAPIIKYHGEIYQYVGDEIVVTWKLKNGLKNNNCIQCFFAMKAALEKQADIYHAAFGVLPAFKAGFHFGKVTTGEIGVIKKEIIFTGDVLNTTARIQSLCNLYKTDILISGELINRLTLQPKFTIKALGESELRGRGEKIKLFAIVA